jgi:hypothetical protein
MGPSGPSYYLLSKSQAKAPLPHRSGVGGSSFLKPRTRGEPYLKITPLRSSPVSLPRRFGELPRLSVFLRLVHLNPSA